VTTTYSGNGGQERNVMLLNQQSIKYLPGVSSCAADVAVWFCGRQVAAYQELAHWAISAVAVVVVPLGVVQPPR
jgi:hypothetical protein